MGFDLYKKKNNLENIFSNYKNEFQNEELSEIVSRGFVFSELKADTDILICGINPSFRKSECNNGSYSFRYACTTDDRYFNKFHLLFKRYEEEFSINYIDLFYQRHTAQVDLYKFYKEIRGIDFLSDQLKLTQQIVETVKPKAVFVFNRMAAIFWGKNKKVKGNQLSNVWLGYDFEKLQIDDAYSVAGFCNSTDRVKGIEGDTNLGDTIFYFSRFLNRFTPKKELEKINDGVESVCRIIKNGI